MLGWDVQDKANGTCWSSKIQPVNGSTLTDGASVPHLNTCHEICSIPELGFCLKPPRGSAPAPCKHPTCSCLPSHWEGTSTAWGFCAKDQFKPVLQKLFANVIHKKARTPSYFFNPHSLSSNCIHLCSAELKQLLSFISCNAALFLGLSISFKLCSSTPSYWSRKISLFKEIKQPHAI